MNKRLKEIEEQCETKEMGYYFFDREKFARLIILQCAKIYEGVYTDQQRPERIDTRIKQYFSVEE